ncbi:MAG: 4-alpha-glucanotransferase [Acidobacteria bacterium]|nr:MAG: 4-alpha-glucanotransferase [Acidobacteriota bacterium]
MPQPALATGRHAGLLIPLFSIPSSRSWGIGEIGDIPAFASWLRRAGQNLLQLLPINEMAIGQRSPYSAMTAMAIDPIFISVHEVEDFEAAGGEEAMGGEWRAALERARRSVVVDYDLVRRVKEPALRLAFARFHDEEWTRATRRAHALKAWCVEQAWWLDDYALFRALHAYERERPWNDWPDGLAAREAAALAAARKKHEAEILYRSWLQWVADLQWHTARQASKPVSLLGDLPFMVDGDSADVWGHADEFHLDAAVGAPPDAFSEDGQNWGLPVYRWEVLRGRGFDWLRQRAQRSADLYDGYRVDHLVGFYRTYVFPRDGSEAYFTPEDEDDQLELGETVLGVFAEPGSRIIAEDLGTIPDFVRTSLARLGIPGYKVFRWEREWEEPSQPYRDPAAYAPASVATTGTHDTETVAQWWDGLDEEERESVLQAPGVGARLGKDDAVAALEGFTPALRDVLLEVLFASGSDFLLLPVQDVFGWPHRINVPASQGDHNWNWRLPWPVDTLENQPEAIEPAERLAAWSRRWRRAAVVNDHSRGAAHSNP